MGFGFNLGMIFVVLPLTAILFLLYLKSKQKIFSQAIIAIWIGGAGIVVLSLTKQALFGTIELTKEDYYGDYIINRKRLRGKQTDWQYNHYRFTIDKNDTFTLYEIDDNDSTHIFKGKISTVTPHSSARLIIKPDSPNHHFFASNPTTYRKGKKFRLVFESKKFSNMFFKKGTWQPID